MAFEQRDNSGGIWVNDRKSEESHPDRTGSALIGGREYWVNGWLRKTKDGKPYLSLAFKPKQESSGDTSRKQNADDEIPF
jgi:hypothetical protein